MIFCSGLRVASGLEILGGEFLLEKNYSALWSFNSFGFESTRQIWWMEILGGEEVSVYVHSKIGRVDVGLVRVSF